MEIITLSILCFVAGVVVAIFIGIVAATLKHTSRISNLAKKCNDLEINYTKLVNELGHDHASICREIEQEVSELHRNIDKLTHDCEFEAERLESLIHSRVDKLSNQVFHEIEQCRDSKSCPE